MRIVLSERDNYRHWITEVEDWLWEKEDMLDKVRKEYNDLMEKYLKTPKKVTTTSTTIKTVVDQDPTEYDLPHNQIENGSQVKAIEG